jgi:hypothetical protein
MSKTVSRWAVIADLSRRCAISIGATVTIVSVCVI